MTLAVMIRFILEVFHLFFYLETADVILSVKFEGKVYVRVLLIYLGCLFYLSFDIKFHQNSFIDFSHYTEEVILFIFDTHTNY